MYGLITQICALFIITALNIVYFKRNKVKTTETDLYSVLLVTTLLGTIIDVVATSFTLLEFNIGLVIYVNKLYFFFLCTIGLLMFYYAYYVARGMTNKEKKQLTRFTFYISGLISIFFIILPIDVNLSDSLIIVSGTLKTFTNTVLGFWSTLIILLIIYRFYKDKQDFKKEKLIPLFMFVISLILIGITQEMTPSLSIITFALVFNILLMFFTIENPDIRLIEEINIAKNQALKASNAKTDFLSNISHEIRTPLNAIVGFSQLLKEQDLPSQIKEDIDDIAMASNSLLDIINGVLDLSKIEANKLEITNKEYELKKVYSEAIKLAKTKIGKKDIKFNSSYDESTPEFLYGDDIRIKQIILNLLTNAIKYTDKGFVKISLTTEIKNDNCRLVIEVEDTGQGIKKDDLNNLFNKFQRLNEDKNVNIEGTGLGLVITKKLTELMNGKIEVESEFNKGSKFIVTLNQKIVVGNKSEQSKNIKEQSKFPTKKILLVDDNAINLKVAEKLLAIYECQITSVQSGQECLDIINTNFDLIFLDDMMPVMTGTETLKKLKEQPSFSTPVVVLTANALSEMKNQYLDAGFDDYISKPINRNELDEIVTKFLK